MLNTNSLLHQPTSFVGITFDAIGRIFLDKPKRAALSTTCASVRRAQ